MGYINLSDACSRIYVQTGMVNRSQDAEKSARQLSELLKQRYSTPQSKTTESDFADGIETVGGEE